MDNNNGPSERKRRSDRHEKEEKRTFFMIVRDFFTTTGKETIDDAIDETKIYRPSRKFQTYEKETIARKTRMDKYHNEKEEIESVEIDEIDEVEETDKTSSKRRKFFTIKKLAVFAGSVFLLLLIGYTTLLYGGKMFVDEKKLFVSSPTTIETEDGEVIWYLYDEYRLPVELEEIPEHVQNAFLAIEDKRFYEHSGVDMRSIGRALYRDIITRSKAEGGSTITQQLAKNLFLTNDKSWYRKVKEGMISLYLEREYTKDEIFEMYLNVIYFGQGRYGIEAAANKYFNKSVQDLNLEEGALLAGMVKGPNGYSPIDHPDKAKNRRDVVLQTMADLQLITVEEAEEAKAKGVNLQITERKTNPAYEAYVDLVIQEVEEEYGLTLEDLKATQYRIRTGMNKEAQNIAFEEFQQDTYFPGNSMKNVEGAFLMMEGETGQIAAAIGGRNFKSSQHNRAVARVGQPGSTMKPLAVYGPALETGDYTPFSMLEDEMKEWEGKPVRNANEVYNGEVSLYDALVQSKNTSAVWLLDQIGIDYGKSYLEKMGIEFKDKNLRIALGGLENGITLKEMVQGYRTFTNSGRSIEAHAVIDIHDLYGNEMLTENHDETEVFSEQVAWNLLEIMKAVVTNGTAQSGYYPHELAGKTGSTQHPKHEGQTKDAWFVGMTPEYVTALWMGYDDISEEGNYLFGGSSYPTVMTKTILTKLNEQQSLEATFTKPEKVDALEEPIQLPVITDLKGSHTFGGFKLMKGKLSWTKQEDDRIIYRIYEQKNDKVQKIGEVIGKNEFTIDKFSLFDGSSYYVVPYDTLTDREGEKSNSVKITF